MSTQYRRGRDFEYKVRDFLREFWPLVVRAAGSKGPVDLICVRPLEGRVLLVSCKRAAYWPPEELSALKDLRGKNVLVSKAYLNKAGKLEFDGV